MHFWSTVAKSFSIRSTIVLLEGAERQSKDTKFPVDIVAEMRVVMVLCSVA